MWETCKSPQDYLQIYGSYMDTFFRKQFPCQLRDVQISPKFPATQSTFRLGERTGRKEGPAAEDHD